MNRIRLSRKVPLFLLVSFLSTPVSEMAVAARVFLSAEVKTCRPEDERPEERRPDPMMEAARKAWLQKFGDKWGLDETSNAKVVCTCTCCGDSCPMGAACCCAATKYPVDDSQTLFVRGPGCATDPGKPATYPASINWTFLLAGDGAEASVSLTASPSNVGLNKRSWISELEPPPPRHSFRSR